MYACVWRQDSERSCMRVSGDRIVSGHVCVCLGSRIWLCSHDFWLDIMTVSTLWLLFLTLLMNMFYDDYFQLILFSLSMGSSTKLEMILCTILTPCFKIRLVLKLNCFKIEINFNFRFEDCGNEFYYLIKVFILKDNISCPSQINCIYVKCDTPSYIV